MARVLWSRFSNVLSRALSCRRYPVMVFVNLWPGLAAHRGRASLVSVSLAGLGFSALLQNLGHDRPSSLGLLVLPQKANIVLIEFAEHLDALPYSYQPGSGSGGLYELNCPGRAYARPSPPALARNKPRSLDSSPGLAAPHL